MEVICLEDAAFFNLFERVINHVKEKPGAKPDKWISGEEAMKMLRITSKTTFRRRWCSPPTAMGRYFLCETTVAPGIFCGKKNLQYFGK